MVLRSIIIDDEQKGIDALKILLERFISEVNVVAETINPSEAKSLIENYRPEIVFLDINMPEMNGFELLETLTWKNFNLVFVTAHEEHALRALKSNAMDYLLKPVDHEDLRLTVEKIKNQVNIVSPDVTKLNYQKLFESIYDGKKNRIIINSRAGIESIDVDSIISLESKSNYTQISLTDGREITSSKTLKDFDEQLCTDGSNFMRVHHSFIINLHKVQRFLKKKEDIIMINDQVIPVAKSRKDDFMKWLET
jgi:two-component system LytT family response regulator